MNYNKLKELIEIREKNAKKAKAQAEISSLYSDFSKGLAYGEHRALEELLIIIKESESEKPTKNQE
jgi:hypothetical protein